MKTNNLDFNFVFVSEFSVEVSFDCDIQWLVR